MVRHFHVRHFILSRPTCMYSIMHVDMYVFFMSPSLCPSYRWGRVVGPSVRAYADVMGRRHSQTGLPTASSLCMCAHTVNKLDPPQKKEQLDAGHSSTLARPAAPLVTGVTTVSSVDKTNKN